MENAIIAKLRKELSGSIDTEPKVVYFLCEIRKLLEARGLDRAAKAVRLFCHWALHVHLDKPGTTKHFLQEIDEALTNLFENPPSGATIAHEHRLFEELAYFDTFRSELGSVLRDYGLPTDLCDDNVRWANFLLAYSGVIEDGTLACDLRWVRSVAFTIDERVGFEDAHLPFQLVWIVALRQPFKGFSKVEVNATGTEDRRMLGWGYSLQR